MLSNKQGNQPQTYRHAFSVSKQSNKQGNQPQTYRHAFSVSKQSNKQGNQPQTYRHAFTVSKQSNKQGNQPQTHRHTISVSMQSNKPGNQPQIHRPAEFSLYPEKKENHKRITVARCEGQYIDYITKSPGILFDPVGTLRIVNDEFHIVVPVDVSPLEKHIENIHDVFNIIRSIRYNVMS
ncbi:unnamed protein product [Diatraea saccharalis]|uniref:Uncharacterized protein n=1 Tax=Diatraea saccharalis TaxID=40085 RepID=A0A9N9WG91_9NEOP|nr:unnamed protein product [Diatraea saccharalis]